MGVSGLMRVWSTTRRPGADAGEGGRDVAGKTRFCLGTGLRHGVAQRAGAFASVRHNSSTTDCVARFPHQRRGDPVADHGVGRKRLRRDASCYEERKSEAGGFQAIVIPWFLSGRERIRLPVAAKIALQIAGAMEAWPGSPTPPQKPPDGAITTSTLGISARRIMR
jgi:hypothetical protein